MGDFVHLSIDLDVSNLVLLGADRRRQLREEARRFADGLRARGIPTIWIAFPRGSTEFSFVARETVWPFACVRQRPQKQIKLADLHGMDIKTDEDVFVKGGADAFQGGILAQHLWHKYRPRSIILTGGTTTVCVASTLYGAAKAGLNCVVIYDRLYSLMAWDSDPLRHRDHLLGRARELGLSRQRVVMSDQTLRMLPLQPIPERVSFVHAVGAFL